MFNLQRLYLGGAGRGVVSLQSPSHVRGDFAVRLVECLPVRQLLEGSPVIRQLSQPRRHLVLVVEVGFQSKT